MAQYVRANPVVLTLPLDVALAINTFLPQTPPGALITAITLVHIDPGVTLLMSYGQQASKQVFQGQSFTFGSVGDCVGVMDLGLSFGTGGVAVPGGTVQIELSFLNDIVQGLGVTVRGQ